MTLIEISISIGLLVVCLIDFIQSQLLKKRIKQLEQVSLMQGKSIGDSIRLSAAVSKISMINQSILKQEYENVNGLIDYLLPLGLKNEEKN